MVTFSIITPFYKGNKYVSTLIRMAEENAISLNNAGIHSRVELILVNDSPFEDVILSKGSDIISIKVIKQEKNMGIHQARVSGLSQSEGEFILFLDQDDEISAECLLKEYNIIENNEVVIANALFENPDGSTRLHFKGVGQYRNAFEIMPYVKGHNQIISPGHCLIRKDSIPKEWTEYIMKTNGSDDLFLWILMLLKKKKFVMLKEPLYIHKYTGGNLSAEGEKMAESTLEMTTYLQEIDYVPEKIINNIIRSRSIKIQWNKKSKIEKLVVILKNIDIYTLRVIWKIRAGMGKISY